ncbi:MAG TPA: hypothetical protein VI297_08335 [Gemmatimonadales bacterium]
MQRTQRLTLLSTLTAAALAGVTVTAGAQQEPYPQKPPASVETGAVDSTKQMTPPENPTVAPGASAVTPTDTAMTDKDKAKKKKLKPGETPDTTKPKQ